MHLIKIEESKMEPVKKHKKHKKHKSERKHKYDGKLFNNEPLQKFDLFFYFLERPAPSLKLILKVSGTPEYNSIDSPYQVNLAEHHSSRDYEHSHEKHKKSKKKKKKKDRDKKHKHHKKDRHKHESSMDDSTMMEDEESGQMYYASMSTSSAISANPVTKPMIPLSINTAISEQKTFHTLQNVSQIVSPTPSATADFSSQLQVSPMTPPSDSGREPRTCVLKLKQSRSPLAKLLENVLKALEKRDPHQFFQWPVTDDIAPGYSAIISKPMDFSSIRQKNEENKYSTLQEFADDFQLMCDNAIKYNHHETVYNKAARKLLQAGMRLFLPENIMRGPYAAFIRDISAKELGFDPNLKLEPHDESFSFDSAEADDIGMSADQMDPMHEERERRERIKAELDPKTPFEPFVDALTSDELLEQVQRAAREARSRLNKRKAHSMGFLRSHADGTTSMKIIIPSEEGVPEKTKKLGEFTGKLEKGTGLLQSFREDRRNTGKLPKPLNYGSFSSFAPTFDTRFTNLSVEETEMILNTYGSDDGANYATSITRFSQDSVYGGTLANKLLDLLTHGEHSKTMETLMEAEQVKQNQKEVDKLLPNYQKEAKQLESVTVDFDELKSLREIGVDVKFLKTFEKIYKNGEQLNGSEDVQAKLDNTTSLIEQLHQTQNDRLSAPLPQHLSLIARPNSQEVELANQITSNITNIAKSLAPCAITSAPGVRKALGMSLPQGEYRRALSKFSNNKTIDVDATEVDMELEPPATAEFDHLDSYWELNKV